MPEATLRRMVDLAEPLYLQSGDYLYAQGEAPDYSTSSSAAGCA